MGLNKALMIFYGRLKKIIKSAYNLQAKLSMTTKVTFKHEA